MQKLPDKSVKLFHKQHSIKARAPTGHAIHVCERFKVCLITVYLICEFIQLISYKLYICPLPPLGHIWDVMVWRNINRDVPVLQYCVSIIMVHNGMSSSDNWIQLWSYLV